MRPADHGPRGTLPGSLRATPGNAPGLWSQENMSGQQFYGNNGISASQQNVPFSNSTAIPTNLPGLVGQNNQMDFSSLQGIQFPTFSGMIIPDQSFAPGSHTGHLANSTAGPRLGYPVHSANVSRSGADTATQESVEERKRLEHQRQQTKMRQSFQASKNKNLNPDDLMGKIIADFGPIPQKSIVKIGTDQREVQSRPSTPHASPVAPLHRDRSGSLNISPQNSARLPEPVSDPSQNTAAFKSSSEQRSKIPELSDLMMKFSDLSASSGGSVKMNFSSPQIKNQSSIPVRNTAFFNDSQSAVDWKSVSSDLTSAFSTVSATGTGDSSPAQSDLPPWCSDMNSLPNVYRGVLALFKNQLFIPKSAIFPVLSRSGLGLKTLEHIWSATCRTKVDFLSRSELCAALGLIGLAQTNFDVAHLTVEVLRRIPNPPEPFFVTSPPPQIVQPLVNPYTNIISNTNTNTNTNMNTHTNSNLNTNLNTNTNSNGQFFGLEFQNIPLNSFTANPVPVVSHNEEEEFADFVSAPTVQAENPKVSQIFSAPEILPKLEIPKATKSVSLPQKSEKERKNSNSSVADDPGWGDWAQTESFESKNQNFQKPAAILPSFRPEMVGRSHSSVSSTILPPVQVQSTTDPYSALRDLVVPTDSAKTQSEISVEFDKKKSQIENLTVDSATKLELWSDPPTKGSSLPQFSEGFSSTTAEFHTTSPPSGDDLSLQSLDFGAQTGISGDFGLISADEAVSLPNSESIPNLVLDNLEFPNQNLDFGLETRTDDFQNEIGNEVELEHAEVWIRALQACAELIEEACGVFNSVDNSTMLMKVLAKARDHIQNLMEVYRVARRVYIGAKSFGSMEDQRVVDAIKATEEAWTDFMSFLSMAAMEPQPGSMDFSKADLSAQNPPISSICGVCLLDVDAESRARKSQIDGHKIKHENRFYHVTCANFWLNCVDIRLPRLTYKN